MPSTEDIRAHWDKQAALGEKAGTQDLILKQLEQRAILAEIDEDIWMADDSVLEIGCGDGVMASLVHPRLNGACLTAIDSSEAMLRLASRFESPGLHFALGDVADLPVGPWDMVYSQRCLINLPTWGEQKAAIDGIAARLVPGGRFLMCEHSADGLDAINASRGGLGLPAIQAPWHNRYFRHRGLETITSLRLLRCISFSAAYYFLSRVLNAKLAADEGREPDYDAPVNRLALELPYSYVDPRFAQGRLWVWEKP